MTKEEKWKKEFGEWILRTNYCDLEFIDMESSYLQACYSRQEETNKLKEYTMSLAKLKKILDEEFGPPFLPKGMVTTKWDEDLLVIKIGRRDIEIDNRLKVHASGTDLTC